MLRFLSKTIATLFFGPFALFASSPVALAIGEFKPANPVFLGVILCTAFVCFTASTGRKAWARGSIFVGVLFIALPLAVAIMAGLAVNEVVLQNPSSNLKQRVFGAAVSGAVATTVSVVIGIVLGAIFVLLGLVLNRRGPREAIDAKK